MNVFIMIGAPGSGKSTLARELVKSRPKTIIVNKDFIRTMLWGGEYRFVAEYEPLVGEIIKSTINHAIENGFNVIIDETNLKSEKRKNSIKNIFRRHGENVIISYIVFPILPDLLERRMTDPRGISREKWNEVIQGMLKNADPITDKEMFNEVFSYENGKLIDKTWEITHRNKSCV